jgi:hypothetical protein
MQNITMAEFFIHRRSGIGFPAKRLQGRVSCCPSMTLARAGLIPISGGTESERAGVLSASPCPKEDKLFYRQDDYKV